MIKRLFTVVLALLMIFLWSCDHAPSQPAGSDSTATEAPGENVSASGLPEMGKSASRSSMTLHLENRGSELSDLQVLLIWRFYTPQAEPVDLDTLPAPEAEAMLGLSSAPEFYGPVVQDETAVMMLPVGQLPAGEATELLLPQPGEGAWTVRADLFVRSWSSGEAEELFSDWWQYPASGGSMPTWDSEPILPELDSPCSLGWQIENGAAVLTGMGSWPISCLYVPDVVYLSEVPARTVTVLASQVRDKGLFSGLGKEYWLERPDGTLIKDREELTRKNEVISRLLVTKGKTFPKHVIRGLEFPELILCTEDGTELTPNNVKEVVTAGEYSETQPLYLQVLPQSGTCLAEDPVSGRAYPVLIRGNAFAGSGLLRSVRFCPDCSLENGSMNFVNTGMFSGCTALEEVLCFPAQVSSMEGAFAGCTALSRLEGLPETASSLKDTFFGCTALRTLPPLPAGAASLERCFFGCTALEAPPIIGPGAEDLRECFSGCTALTLPPLLPEGVENMERCFFDCTSLTQAPELPETVKDLTRCFSGCSELRGEITVPSSALTPTSLLEINLNFSGCPHIEAVHLQYCGYRQYPKTLPGDIPITADCTHVEQGLCPYCHYANLETEIDGLPVVFDAVYEPYYLAAVSYLDDGVPAYLKDSCTRLIFTEDMDRYYHNYVDGMEVREVAGYADGSDGHACVRTYSYEQVSAVAGYVERTIIHELAHCYDFCSEDGRRATTGDWLTLFSREGDKIGQYYGPAYQSFSRTQRIAEAYATAVECYVHIPNELSRVCPGMYSYLQENLPNEG